MVNKILITCITILVIFFLLKKKNIENFKTNGEIEIKFSAKDSIFMVSDDITKIEQSVEGTIIHKTSKLIYSNKEIFSDSGKHTGFLFSIKPNQKLKIGFSNKDKEDEISHSINIIGDGLFQISEKIQDSDQYAIQDIDYCLSRDIKSCLNTKDKYTFNPTTDFLAIMVNENRANYLIIKRNEEGEYGSMLIHRGSNPLKFPYRLKVISVDEKCVLSTLLWTKHTIVYNSPVYWSVETQFKDEYDNKPLEMVPMPSYTIEEKSIPAPSNLDDGSFDFGNAFSSGVKKILITSVGMDGEFYEMEFIHNLEELYLQINKDRIFLKLYLDDDTYIFKKYQNPETTLFKQKQKIIFRNIQTVENVEIVIGDTTSLKYKINKQNDININIPINSPSPF